MNDHDASRDSPVINARDITKTYGRGDAAFRALRGVSLSVWAGESVAIVGKSGSGKSTLMHILGLLDTADGGVIEVDGTHSSSLRDRDRNRVRNQRFGFVFQQFYLNPMESVLDNVAMPLKLAGVPRRKRWEVAEDLLEHVGLADKAGNRATELSGGQKQRVAVARALSNNPQVVFADEPTGNLDSDNGARIEDLLFSLHRDQGAALVVVTHDTDLAARCDRQVVMRDGTLRDSATEGGVF